MPAIAWLSMHPPSGDVFPWWTDWFLAGMGSVALAGIAFIVAVYVRDAWLALRRRMSRRDA